MRAVVELGRPGELQALAHPLRVRALQHLRTAASAAEVARALGEPRQKMNFHLKQLARARLIRKVGERRSGGFVEALYQAVARAFVVSPRVTWGHRAHVAAVRGQLPLRSLVTLGERLQRDAASLLDRAAFDGAEIPSASIESEVRFGSEADRARFMKEYLAAVGPLVKRHGAATGAVYRLITAVYPDPRREERS